MIFPLAYLAFLNFNSSSVFAVNNFSSPDSEHDQVVVVESSKLFFTRNSQTQKYELALKDGSKVSFDLNRANLPDLFSEWKQTPQSNSTISLEPPTDCKYLNIVVNVKGTSIQDIDSNLERIYCSTKIEPNFSYIP
ncbi:MAG: hypothetical protein ACMG57_05165 [Candidatus Dojkabacteria bacterium]